MGLAFCRGSVILGRQPETPAAELDHERPRLPVNDLPPITHAIHDPLLKAPLAGALFRRTGELVSPYR